MSEIVPRSTIRQLAAQGTVTYISPDRPVRACGHLTITTGADQVRKLAYPASFDGTGIGVTLADATIFSDRVVIKALSHRSTHEPWVANVRRTSVCRIVPDQSRGLPTSDELQFVASFHS